MLRKPFVWETQVRREALDDEMVRLRHVPYSLWRHVVTSPIKKTITARDNKPYLLRVTAEYVRNSPDICVTMSLARSTILRRNLMRQTFVIAPDNRLKS
jgi:hypothetical protein